MTTLLLRFLSGKTAVGGLIAAWVSVVVMGDVTIANALSPVLL